MNKALIQALAVIQQGLKAPKSQNNTFGKYKYRNCEDILEAVKPMLGELALFINDDVVLIGDRYYVKATVTLTDGDASIHNTAYARESLSKKGMDDSQVTGSTSSYARKYAMNGLFCIDDTKDADSFDNSKPTAKPEVIDDNKEWYTDELFDQHSAYIAKQKIEGVTSDNIIKNMRNTWKVANKYQQRVEDLK